MTCLDGVWFGVACDERSVFATSFSESQERCLHGLMESAPSTVPFRVVSNGSVFAEQVLLLLKDIYDGKDIMSDVFLAMERLPSYTQRVLRAVRLIPIGYVASYGGVAEAVGGGARAVGNAMATNPFAPLVPCHRIVGANLSLGGYGGGLSAKVAFLTREKRGFCEDLEIPVEGGKLKVFPVERVLNKYTEFH